ncbi:MAG TPA: hypothetical protein VGD88_11985 [Opitutaceae bacterium]
MSSASKSPTDRPALPWLVLASAAAVIWLWINLCRFPASPWNDLRLAPVFMAAQGVPVYTLPGEGILTTWMYGPVPLWLWWPATLAQDAFGALMTAGALNTMLTVAALAATCRWWPAPGISPTRRSFAFAACLVLWPDHAFRFLQADNVAVALGLVANLLLATNRPGRRGTLWLAALTTAAALGCKQTTLGLPVAQFIWLWLGHGRTAALAHAARVATCGAVLLGLAGAQFGARELWFGLVTVPGALPLAEDGLARLTEMAPHLALQAVLPLAFISVFSVRFVRRGETDALAGLTFLASLPLGLAGVFSTGGTINSFQGYQYLLPALLLFALPRLIVPRAPALLASAILFAVITRIGLADFAPLRPAVADLQRAQALLAARPGELWLPWNPLVTHFAEGRFDHAEDGLYVRFITGHPVSLTQARAGTPPAMKAMAFPTAATQWGVAAKLAPGSATPHQDGPWLILAWD